MTRSTRPSAAPDGYPAISPNDLICLDMRPAAISTGPAWHPARATGIACLAAARAAAAFPSFDGPVPGGQQDVREDNTGGESGSHVQAPQPGK